MILLKYHSHFECVFTQVVGSVCNRTLFIFYFISVDKYKAYYLDVIQYITQL